MFLSVFLLAVQSPVPDTPPNVADVIVDLASSEGAALVQGTWRVRQARVIEVEHKNPGPDRRPSGSPNRTNDIEPRAGARDFDDSRWETVTPESLEERRATGKLCFEWYRIRLTIPEKLGDFSTEGSTVVFEVVVDDYAEVWVDGALPQVLGARGGPLVAGWNAPNRVVIARDVRPGQTIQLALLGANAPLSDPPGNFVWIRSATLDFYRPERLRTSEDVALHVVRLDPALDAIVPLDAKLERVAHGFVFTEGPVWVNDASSPHAGYLLFSDPNANVIHRWAEGGTLSVFRTKSGYKGLDIGQYTQPGSNGLALDAEGRLTICEHGNRRVTRLEKNGTLTVLADRYQGKRLNSPNDLVYRSDGALYFTDPPFGLPEFHADPRRELDFTGVFCLIGGELKLVSTDLAGPNGVAFSPDERFLYVTNWDEGRKVVMRYESRPDGTLADGQVFFDMKDAPEPEALDGVEVDRAGNLFVSGPGGVWVLSSAGKHLGTLVAPELPANFAWGDADGSTLYLTARSGLYRLRLPAPGAFETSFRTVEAANPLPRIERLDPAFDALVPAGAELEEIAQGLAWVEGPLWHPRRGTLLFSDIPANRILEWREGAAAPTVYLEKSGYGGEAPFTGREPGSNGLVLDPEGRLVICEHGNRRITRLEEDGSRTVLAERYQGKRLNSPNDAVFGPDGALYFTDPPFGLPRASEDPAKELPFSGVYRLDASGELALLTAELEAPNGIALAPDARTLYVSNAQRERPVWMAFELRADGSLGPGRVFRDATEWTRSRRGFPDGMKVDRAGNLFAAGPEGIYVFGPNGTHLGTIFLGTLTSNCAFGPDGSSLFVTANTGVYRIRLAPARQE